MRNWRQSPQQTSKTTGPWLPKERGVTASHIVRSRPNMSCQSQGTTTTRQVVKFRSSRSRDTRARGCRKLLDGCVKGADDSRILFSPPHPHRYCPGRDLMSAQASSHQSPVPRSFPPKAARVSVSMMEGTATILKNIAVLDNQGSFKVNPKSRGDVCRFQVS